MMMVKATTAPTHISHICGCTVVRLNIEGMMCTKNCTPKVTAALEAVPGVESVTVSPS